MFSLEMLNSSAKDLRFARKARCIKRRNSGISAVMSEKSEMYLIDSVNT